MSSHPLILRTTKGSRLTHGELDGNFVYLHGQDIKDVTVAGVNLRLTKNNNTVLSAVLPLLSAATTTLADLGDTTITTPIDGDTLYYLGGSWLNSSEVEVYFNVSINNQTHFVNQLPTEPLFPDKTELWVNGQKQLYGLTNDYVLSGATNKDVVWFNSDFILETTDELNIKFK